MRCACGQGGAVGWQPVWRSGLCLTPGTFFVFFGMCAPLLALFENWCDRHPVQCDSIPSRLSALPLNLSGHGFNYLSTQLSTAITISNLRPPPAPLPPLPPVDRISVRHQITFDFPRKPSTFARPKRAHQPLLKEAATAASRPRGRETRQAVPAAVSGRLLVRPWGTGRSYRA